MKHTLRKLKNRIISGLTVLILVLTPMMSPIAVSASGADFGAAKEVVAATPLGDLPEQDSSASENDSSWEDGSYTPENESTAPEEECSETEKDSSSAEEKDSSIVPEQESTVPEKDSVSPEKDSTSPKPDFRESGIENENGDSLYPVLSDTTENAELSIYSSAEDSDVEVTPVQVNTKEEGLEVVKGYIFEGKEDPEMLNAGPDDAGLKEGLEDIKDAHSEEDSEENRPDEEENNSEEDSSEKESSSEKNSENGENTEENETLYVKAETAENVTLSPREKMSLYSVEDGKLKDIIIEDISEDNGLCEIDGDVAGIALVKDTGYRHLNLEVYPDSEDLEKKVTLDGMMPKNANATVIEENDNREVTLVAYDITISDENGEYQPGEDRPIEVTIEDNRISTGLLLSLWHIKDDGSREEITEFTVEDGQIRFTANGFSVYEIVNDVVNGQASTYLQALIEKGEEGFYASIIADVDGVPSGSNGPFYFTGGTVQNVRDNGRTGLQLTGQSSSTPQQAVQLYFEHEESSGETNPKFYIYIKGANDEKKYVRMFRQSSFGNGRSAVDFVSQADRSLFTIDVVNNQMRIHTTIENIEHYWVRNKTGSVALVGYAFVKDGTMAWLTLPGLNDDPYELDGVKYGLMSKPEGNAGYGLMADEDSARNAVEMPSVTVRSDGSREVVYVSEDCDISMWTFHSKGNDDYTLSANTGGATKYLKVNGNDVTITASETDASVFKVAADAKGRITLTTGGKNVYYDAAAKKYVAGNATADAKWLNFVAFSDVSDDEVITYSARKVGVSDTDYVPDGSQVIVYTRVWNEASKSYSFYAIDHDGTLYPCYERGDDIMWVGDKINTLLWNFTEYHYDDGTPNYYYELQNIYSDKYLAPRIVGNQVLSDNTIGINMPGRRDGEYYSTILAWDDPYYSYAGLKADDSDSRIVSCPKAEADDFYFAVMTNFTPSLTTVETIDNHDYGITMRMIDYSPTNDTNEFQNSILGDYSTFDEHKTSPKSGILSTNLIADSSNPDKKYPTTSAEGHSLAELYVGATEVNHLFIKSTYEASGYFEFDSTQNFATLKDANGQTGTDFTVYKELGTSNETSKTTLKHGQFFPYDTITPGVYSSKNPENMYSALADTDNPATGLLPDSDPRKYEKLHAVSATKPNYFNGMELEASFIQTPSGKDAWGHDIIFEFTGDDDFWLYVDDELVIDLGGIHSALAGSVNFSSGKVVVNKVEKDLIDVFRDNYVSRNPSATQAEIDTYLANYFEPGKKIFKDYSGHTMKIFYMERGAGASNLHMRFNLSYVTPGNVIMAKKVTEGEGDNKKVTENLDFDLVEYPYQIWYIDEEHYEEHLLTNANKDIGVFYQNSTQKVDYAASYTPPNSTTTYNSVFFINPGKSAEIKFPSKTIRYRIIECGINEEVYDHVYVNDVELTGTSLPGSKRKSYDSDWLSVEERPNMIFENHINPTALRTLSIKKQLFDEQGHELSASDDETTFSFRLSLSNGADDVISLANMVAYNVKSPAGKLCTWDVNQWLTLHQGFKETPYSTLDPEEGDSAEVIAEKKALKDAVTFETSMNGSISRIPAGYTAEVPNLPVGTRFEVVERDNEIPLGYRLREYDRERDTYKADEDGAYNAGWIRANESPFMYVNNKRGWELEVDKNWSDQKYIETRDSVFTAVYIGDELQTGSVKQMKYPNTSLRYFFDELKEGYSFADYRIYEVELEGATFDTEGNLTGYTGVVRKNDGDLISIRAKAKTASSMESFSYMVNYEIGKTKSTADGTPEEEDDPNGNIRTDTITNTRSGGIVMTLYKMGTKVPLSDGVFILEKYDSVSGKFVEEGTYTSNANGRITILYEHEPNVEYRLTELTSPKNYVGLPNTVSFIVDASDNVVLSGNDPEWQDWNKPEVTDRLVAYINVYNKSYTLEVYKYDGEKTGADGSLESAHFALYRGVTGFGGIVKDYDPIPGYEDLETDSTGRIPSIDNELVSGRYFLVEKTPPPGYTGLDGDIVFDISPLGGFTLVSFPEEADIKFVPKTEGDTYKYFLNIPNTKDEVKLTVSKTVAGAFGNKAKEFTFTFETEDGDPTRYSYTKKTSSGSLIMDQTIMHGGNFTLGHNEEIVITMPADTEVTITESDTESDGYVTTVAVDAQTAENARSKHLKVSDDTTLSFVNTRDGAIPTGVSIPIGMLVLAGLIAFGGIFATIMRQKKMKEQL